MSKFIFFILGTIIGVFTLIDIASITASKSSNEVDSAINKVDKKEIEELIERLNEHPVENDKIIKELFKILEKK